MQQAIPAGIAFFRCGEGEAEPQDAGPVRRVELRLREQRQLFYLHGAGLVRRFQEDRCKHASAALEFCAARLILVYDCM